LGILIVSGDLGSSQNTLGLVSWLLSLFSDFSPGQIDALHAFLRKLGHMLAYGMLCLLWFRAFQTYWPKRRWPFLAWAILCTLAVAVLDEGHQAVVGTRRGSLLDIGWDLAGAGLSAMFILAWRRPKTAAMKG
jgi:VanZ family protein